ncbi:thiamine transporter 1-like [Condylostylus longicornis]|uniref:thiamine transporter 1-like n=1 Tax=Condylostylus longicornis TaxID=2530218 RepID=UPI00244E4E55|nr:thiamine transporter 1-like [Condylostylus longicornis]
MKEWLKISALLCVYGLLRETRPSEPYVTEFLVGEWRNVTLEEVYRDALPVGTYSYLAQLVLIFLITDFFKYKPLIIVSGLAGISVWSMLIWTKSLLELQILEVFYGTYMATEIAYFTYIYAKVDKKYYPKVTSHTRAALLVGKLIASVTSQILVYFEWMNYLELNYITLATQIASTIWAFFLPNVKTTVYFHRKESFKNEVNDDSATSHSSTNNIMEPQAVTISTKTKPNPFKLIFQHFKNAYTNRYIIQWSIWYSTVLCGYLQVISYIQTLWKAIDENPVVAWNGMVDAALTFLGAICALSAGYIHAGRLSNNSSLLVLSILSICKGGALLMAILPNKLYLAYAGYIVFGAVYAFSITVASAEVAKHLEEDSFGLVFGINTFIALVLQTILTVVVVDGHVILIDIFGQYLIYSGYFGIIGVTFGCFVLYEWIMTR